MNGWVIVGIVVLGIVILRFVYYLGSVLLFWVTMVDNIKREPDWDYQELIESTMIESRRKELG